MPALRDWRERASGHWWTIAPTASAMLVPRSRAGERSIGVEVVDDRFGPTRLHGSLGIVEGSRALVLVVHGLGGSRHAGYVSRAARALRAHGFSTLAVDLRGADRCGGGFYHVALVDDLRAFCHAPELAAFDDLFVLGFSMGGHVALHFASGDEDRRLRGVAAVCTPLDLAATQRHIDAPPRWFYRQFVLRGLKQIYAAVARRHDVPAPNEQVQRCRTFLEWDRLTIAPRYGFASPADFYEQMSARRILPRLRVDTRLVVARNDPIIPPELVLPYLDAAPTGTVSLSVSRRGGHLHLPRSRSGGLADELAGHWGYLLRR